MTETLTILGRSEAALIMIQDILSLAYPSTSHLVIVNNIGGEIEKPWKIDEEIFEYEVVEELSTKFTPAVIGAMLPATKKKIYDQYKGAFEAADFVSIYHPDQIMETETIKIGNGVIIDRNVTISSLVEIHDFVTIYPGVVISHHVEIGAFSTICPNATICGGVKIGKGVTVGAGATILPDVTVEDGATIGAGAVVVENVAENKTVIGIPARYLPEK